MEQIIRAYKALSEPVRLRILALLARGELCVCALVEILAMPQSTVSRHLALLRAAGWVSDRRQGPWMYYRLAQDDGPLPAALRRDLLAQLASLAEVRRDRERLELYQRTKGDRACR